MTRLTIYGDFNCPFSALASVRADLLLTAGGDEIEWRGVQHDTTIPAAGEPVEGDTLAELEAEVAKVRELSADDVHLELIVPPLRSNTGAASAAFAAAGDEADHTEPGAARRLCVSRAGRAGPPRRPRRCDAVEVIDGR